MFTKEFLDRLQGMTLAENVSMSSHGAVGATKPSRSLVRQTRLAIGNDSVAMLGQSFRVLRVEGPGRRILHLERVTDETA